MRRSLAILMILVLLIGSGCINEANRIEKANKDLGSKRNPIKICFGQRKA